jgi:hypothetical protein
MLPYFIIDPSINPWFYDDTYPVVPAPPLIVNDVISSEEPIPSACELAPYANVVSPSAWETFPEAIVLTPSAWETFPDEYVNSPSAWE